MHDRWNGILIHSPPPLCSSFSTPYSSYCSAHSCAFRCSYFTVTLCCPAIMPWRLKRLANCHSPNWWVLDWCAYWLSFSYSIILLASSVFWAKTTEIAYNCSCSCFYFQCWVCCNQLEREYCVAQVQTLATGALEWIFRLNLGTITLIVGSDGLGLSNSCF